MGENVIDISEKLIHEVTRLCNQGSIPLNEKNYNGRGIIISQIKQDDIRILS